MQLPCGVLIDLINNRKKVCIMSDKKRWHVVLLCLAFGGMGIHRFYVGKIGTGVIQLVTLSAFGIWGLIDLIMIVTGHFTDKEGKKIGRQP